MEIGSVILAGGKSTRFGSNKLLVKICGKKLVERVLEIASSFGRVYLVSPDPLPIEGDFVLVKDERLGPLPAMIRGFERAEEDYLACLAGDMPLLRSEVLEYLFERARGKDAAIPRWRNGFLEPLCSVYRREAVLEASERLESLSGRRVLDLVRHLEDPVFVSVEDEISRYDPDLLSFVNVNSEEDLELVRRALGTC